MKVQVLKIKDTNEYAVKQVYGKCGTKKAKTSIYFTDSKEDAIFTACRIARENNCEVYKTIKTVEEV